MTSSDPPVPASEPSPKATDPRLETLWAAYVAAQQPQPAAPAAAAKGARWDWVQGAFALALLVIVFGLQLSVGNLQGTSAALADNVKALTGRVDALDRSVGQLEVRFAKAEERLELGFKQVEERARERQVETNRRFDELRALLEKKR